MKTTIPDHIVNDPRLAQADYCLAYSVWLLGERRKPSSQPRAHDFGISEDMAEVLRRQCRSMAHKQLDAQAPAVSFTETEARKAAEDLRDIAASCCERGDTTYEKILRQLAQKFDTWRTKDES